MPGMRRRSPGTRVDRPICTAVGLWETMQQNKKMSQKRDPTPSRSSPVESRRADERTSGRADERTSAARRRAAHEQTSQEESATIPILPGIIIILFITIPCTQKHYFVALHARVAAGAACFITNMYYTAVGLFREEKILVFFVNMAAGCCQRQQRSDIGSAQRM